MGFEVNETQTGVLSLSQNGTASGFEMKHPGTRRLYSYWADLRGERAAPYKSEVTAQGLGRALASNVFMLERVVDGDVRFRLAGSRLHDIFGLEVRGMSALAIVDHADHDRFRAMIEDCLEAPSVGVAECEAIAPNGDAARVEIIVAPLRNDFDQRNRILGAVNVFGEGRDEIAPAPRRCRILRSSNTAIAATSRFEDGGALPGFAEDAAPFDHERPELTSIDGGERRGERRRGHLKVVRD